MTVSCCGRVWRRGHSRVAARRRGRQWCSRFNFTHHPLSDIYIVYNDRRESTGGELIERAFIVKVTNLFNF